MADPHDLFDAFRSASDSSDEEEEELENVSSASDGSGRRRDDAAVRAELERLREENSRLRAALAREYDIEAALNPICHVVFFDNKVSRANRDKIASFLEKLAAQPVSAADATVCTEARPSDAMALRLVQQVQYYFSNDNLQRPDTFMLGLMGSPDGWMPIPNLASFQKIVQLTSNRQWLLYALKRAPLLALDEDETAVRRVRPYSAREAQDSGMKPEDESDSNGAGGTATVVASYTVLPGLSAVIDRHGANPDMIDADKPQYDLLTAVPLPHKYHEGLSMRMEHRCFNCGAVDHALAACPTPRDSARITANRTAHEQLRATMGPKPDINLRYHADQRRDFAHFTPGSITPELREALGLADNELPPWIANMWVHGYPPGYLKRPGGGEGEAPPEDGDDDDADAEPSSITLFGPDGIIEAAPPTPAKSPRAALPTASPMRPDLDVDLVPPEQLVAYPGFNVPPLPGTVVTDPRNKYSQRHDPSRDVIRAMQVHQAHFRKAMRDQARNHAHPYARPPSADARQRLLPSPTPRQDRPLLPSPLKAMQTPPCTTPTEKHHSHTVDMDVSSEEEGQL